jgi:hypothetical protein
MQSLDSFDGRHSDPIEGKAIDIGAFEYYSCDPTMAETSSDDSLLPIVLWGL